ncbi:hypothetical protein J3A64_000688 [Pseudarthrobacter sp. PvP004]|nr:hypothetical protein [Pseudarthrobacter sp. PvP004]
MDMPRRAIVQLGLAGLVLTGCSVKVVENVEPFRLGVTNAGDADKPRVERPEPVKRYQFECRGANGNPLIILSSLEEVWANTQYKKFADVVVTYVGPQPQVLAAEENAAVNVAVEAGAIGTRNDICLAIVKACTRNNPPTISTALYGLGGVPIVKGALTLAPMAPQAAVLTKWLKEVA